MSDEFRMQLGGIDGVGDEGFKIKTICGCRIVYGSVPLSSFAMLTHGFSKKALMATDIADLIGATFVIGTAPRPVNNAAPKSRAVRFNFDIFLSFLFVLKYSTQKVCSLCVVTKHIK